jgi:hypothetical protein
MHLFPLMVMMSFVLLLALVAGDSDGAQKKKKKKANSVKGTVVNVERGKDGAGFITVQPKKTKKQPEAPKQVKIEITKETKFQQIEGKKKDKKTVESSFTAVENGKQVTVSLRSGGSDVADTVNIGGGKKKKKGT